MNYLSLGARIYYSTAHASPAIRRTVAFTHTRTNVYVKLPTRPFHTSKQTLSMFEPPYEMRKTMFGIEDKDLLKDVSVKEDVVFVDVRNPDEIEKIQCCKPSAHAKYLLEGGSAEAAGKDLPNKDAHHIVFCAKGGRASKACQALRSLGYTNVYNAGGVEDLDLFLGN